MEFMLKIIAYVIAGLIALIFMSYIFMRFSSEKVIEFYGAKRKPEKENIVRNVRIDSVED